MIQRKSTFFLGVFILIVSSSFLGLPSFWKTFLLFASGLVLMGLSVKFTLPKKPLKRTRKKEKTSQTMDSITVVSPKSDTPVPGSVQTETISTSFSNLSESKTE